MTSLGQKLADEQQITTPHEWQPVRPVTGKDMLKILAGSLLGFFGSWWLLRLWLALG